jgi:hypothetical protein
VVGDDHRSPGSFDLAQYRESRRLEGGFGDAFHDMTIGNVTMVMPSFQATEVIQ